MFDFLILLVMAVSISFVAGAAYGRAAEQKIVANVLAEYHNASSELQSFISRILSSLDAEYSRIYDQAIADFEKVKKAL